MSVQTTLEKLISFDTTSGNFDQMRAAYTWIQEELKDLPLHYKIHERNDVPSIVITTRPDEMHPKTFLAAHMDVVEGVPDQFTPMIKDGKLHGRGAFDMKYSIACYVELFKELGQDIANYDIGIMLTGDEEVSGIDGTKYLMDVGYRCDVMLLPECGTKPWHFEVGAKGVWRFHAISNGRATHSSRPWDGIDAIGPLCRFVTDMENFFETLKTDDEHNWYPTISPNQIEGGNGALNVLAGHGKAGFDIRFPTPEDGDKIKQKVDELVEKYDTITIETVVDMVPYAITDENVIGSFANVAKELYGITCGRVTNHGSSDARYVVPFGIPVLLIWPIGGGHHQVDEWIDLADLERYYQVVKKWVMDTAKR